MIPYSNYHTHTRYDDGENTPEEMILAAIERGMPSLGFSGHSNTVFDQTYCMTRDRVHLYIKEMPQLKEKYAGRINNLKGIEQDYYGDAPSYEYDYIIGSCHYIATPGGFSPVDDNESDFVKCVETYYRGDYAAYARDYYSMAEDVKRKTGCLIVGHFDLMNKFNDGDRHFDSRGGKYLSYAYEAARSLCRQDAVFEINTGVVWKKYRSGFYPDEPILRAIREAGGRITLSSDSHDAASLCCYFDEAAQLARACGFREYYDIFSDSMLPL